MITLLNIAKRAKRRAPMQTLAQANITLAAGVDDDFRGKPTKRQVSVLSAEAWQQACDSLQTTLPWTIRRANLLISGYQFSADDVGKEIHIGEVRLLICKETDPCPRMDEQHMGLQQALSPDWRGGVCCKVLASGVINIGDHIYIVTASDK
ncbi:MOSC domain-containing protein [Alteromonadaceae bacterium BrNp21-10]|nr:MOSC domain-containing protein [Alteromonadaceae bacterium BrNp21-10]